MEIQNRQQIGMTTEKAALRFLENQGLQLIQQNYRCYVGEIDLVMQDQEDIVFVEVRYRENNLHGSALESIDRFKMNKLIRTATYFLQDKRWLYTKCSRFDVVAMHADKKGQFTFDWIKCAFTIDN